MIYHPGYMKKSELRKLVGFDRNERVEHWSWERQFYLLTAGWTPLVYGVLLSGLLAQICILYPMESINELQRMSSLGQP